NGSRRRKSRPRFGNFRSGSGSNAEKTQKEEMIMEIFWFIPTHGDGRYLGTTLGGRETNLAYLRQIAQAADQLGYAGVLLPTGKSCEDAWVVASSLISSTRN